MEKHNVRVGTEHFKINVTLQTNITDETKLR